MDDLIWLAYPSYVGGLFFVLLVLFHVVFVYPDKIKLRSAPYDDVFWKKVDYIWVSIACLSLISAAGEARKVYSATLLNMSYGNYQGKLDLVLEPLVSGKELYCDTPSIRTKDSPPDFDDIEHQKQLTCAWYSAVLKRIDDNKRDAEEIGIPRIIVDKAIKRDFLLESIHWRQQKIREYNSFKAYQREMVGNADRTRTEQMLILFLPLLLSFAAALRLAKISGEIRLSRLKSKQVSEAKPEVVLPGEPSEA